MQDFREELIRDLHWSLSGPRLDDSDKDFGRFDFLNGQEGDPGSRFITGILSPQMGIVDDESSLDDTPFSSTGCSDSSFGFTFCIPFSAEGPWTIHADLSHYERAEGVPWNLRKEGTSVKGFRRIPSHFEESLDLKSWKEGGEKEWKLLTFGPEKDGVVDIKLLLVHRRDMDVQDGRVFTLSIFNEGKVGGGRRPWNRTAFHVSLRVISEAGFAALPSSSAFFNEEGARSDLLYRNVKRHAIGHGCGTQFIDEREIRTTFFPEETVPVFTHRSLETEALNMEAWAKGGLDVEVLDVIPDHYAAWLEDEMQAGRNLSEERKAVLKANLEAANLCVRRMRSGIKRLKTDRQCRQAFCWMNEAMLVQQVRSKLPRVDLFEDGGAWRYGEVSDVNPLDRGSWSSDLEYLGRWRLFQMAFILMCLDDVSGGNPEEHLDLIWFPTGGGKTEAYLGLSAFLLLYDRMSEGDIKGVRILMRYTLRLLTSQQFERASSLILALDEIRQRESELGQTAFSIGLWVGGGVTFNTQKGAAHWYSGLETDTYSKWDWVLQRCPRCAREFGLKREGGAMRAFGVTRDSRGHVHFACNCHGGEPERLPIHVVDDDVYDELPSLIVATVDKFARLPWKHRSSRLLGVHALGRGEHSKLVMIIQDELHLMDGPLGTIAGLYEAGIDYLISKTGAKPKRIGSSATLAMAGEQCRDLYGVPLESVRIFPAPVLNWDDNHYSFVDSTVPGRKYVGLYANGSPSNKTTQYKLFAALMRTGGALAASGNPVAEGYSTLINYFNSRRDQGQALSLMGDDVPRELRLLAGRNGDEKRTYIDISDRGLVQLHGNVKSDEVQRSFARLVRKVGDRGHVRTVLATNMISVGLDVPRLGLMAMVHQPKSMSEYIQASSRVGRGRTPGLVVVMLSALRSRDKSHLEDFSFTHRRMYSLVEPSSLTPYSASALERALPGVVVSMVRNAPDHHMEDAPVPIPDSLKEEIHEFLLNRLKVIDPDEEVQFSKSFLEICRAWNTGGYHSYGQEVNIALAQRPLMVPFITPVKTDVRPFQVLQAMRNVDSGLKLEQIAKHHA